MGYYEFSSPHVSNPIREYLQIGVRTKIKKFDKRFKPYKGVSSNVKPKEIVPLWCLVSNPIREYLQIQMAKEVQICICSFKPYKGVSSNEYKEIIHDMNTLAFQTL